MCPKLNFKMVEVQPKMWFNIMTWRHETSFNMVAVQPKIGFNIVVVHP